MSSLEVPYLVYGYVYQDDGATPMKWVPMTVTSTTQSSSTTGETDENGQYTIDLQSIPDCDDGDNIEVKVDIFDEPSDTFTLDLSELFKNIDLTTDWDGVNKDLLIYYDSLTGSDYIPCDCSRWDVDNYSVIIETWLTKSQLKTLRDNIRPGATGELFSILSRPYFYDMSWDGSNTVRFVGNPKYNPRWEEISTLPSMRSSTIGYVRNITTHPVSHTGYIHTKLECYVSGSVL